jgi:hypothetical protein
MLRDNLRRWLLLDAEYQLVQPNAAPAGDDRADDYRNLSPQRDET